jgi:hypothetical protein
MRNTPAFALLVAAFSLTSAIRSHAAFVLFENFDALVDGALSGQGGWTGNSVATVVNTGGGDKVANLATGGGGNLSNFRPLGGLAIPNTNAAATVYWNFTISAAGSANNWNFIITDVLTPADTAAASEVQFNFDGGQPAVRARSGGAFLNLSLDGTVNTHFLPLVGVQYNGWFEINNTTDTYSLYLQSDGDPLVGSRTQMLAANGTGGLFTFRNSGGGIQANDLITSNFGSGSSGSVVRFDDIYVDTAGFNAANPVPEPAAGGIGLMAGLVLLSRRRR